ncbi:MAG: protein kinase [Proteobacteria bacterium]|nr:protein kinase [Pseudomonadota bacterium]
MNPTHYPKLDELFDAAIDMTPGEQAAYLDEICSGNPALRQQAEQLLDADRESGGCGDAQTIGLGAGLPTVTGRDIGMMAGGYRINERLDEGGMGIVYLANHEHLNKKAVVKVLKEELASSPESVKRFQYEAQLAAKIRHPGIVDVVDVGTLANGRLYILMEFLDGESLKERLIRVGMLPASEAVSHIQQAARALAAAHDEGIVHRDLKPGNIFLVPDPEVEGGERVKLLDFGIAKLIEKPGDRATQSGMLVGTLPYMSPEQCLAATVDQRSDLYTLGVVFFEMLCGRWPFIKQTYGEYIIAHVHESPPSVQYFNPDVATEISELVSCLLQKHAADRHQSAHQLVDALEAIRTNPELTQRRRSVPPIPVETPQPPRPGWSTGLATVTVSPGPAAAPTPLGPAAAPRRRRWLLAGSATGTIAVVTLMWLLFASTDPGPEAPLSPHSDTIAAIRLVGAEAAVPTLYEALKSGLPMTIQAARALRDMRLPEAAPRVRAMLDRYGNRSRVELAACLLALGEDDAANILERALDDEAGLAVIAAVALAEAGRADKAKPVLSRTFTALPRGGERWRQAARGLRALGDVDAQTLLRKELARLEPERAVPAAEILALENDRVAIAYLQRTVANPPSIDLQGEAALVLARVGQRNALVFVPVGLDSERARSRQLAIAVAARLARRGGDQYAERIAALARDDDALAVRVTARVALLQFSSTVRF